MYRPWSEVTDEPSLEDVTPYGNTKVCVDWITRFHDAGHGEDYAKRGGEQHSVDASFAKIQVGKVLQSTCSPWSTYQPDDEACVDVFWQGKLDINGCAQLGSIALGEQYVLWIYTQLERQSQSATIAATINDRTILAGPGPQNAVRRFRLPFVPPVPASEDVLLQVPFHPVNNAAAAMSRALQTPGLINPNLSQSYTLEAGLGCPLEIGSTVTSDDACAGGNGKVWTGRWLQSNGRPAGLQSKYTLVHEIGHTVMGWAVGNPARNYDTNATEELCTCDHVVGTGANSEHCLQSREQGAAAQLEGFGHFAAARAWNDRNGSDCRFNYYKPMKFTAISNTEWPPVDVSCRMPDKWRNNHCYQATRGTEWDWMQFYWTVNTVGVNKSLMNDLWAIYSDPACCGSNGCGDDAVVWADVRAGAEGHYGSFDPRYFNLRDRGAEFGVNDEPP